jgi:NADPH:quinone reductase-like Zn-dependent oxidoreductase
MKAIVYARFGGPDALELRDVPQRDPKPDEVLVRVQAAAINPIDWKILRGEYPFLAGRRLPRRTGSDFAGRVIATGAGIRRFRVGDAVLGTLNPFSSREGSLAESLCIPETTLARRPETLPVAEAAALSVAGVSAHDCLRRLGGARAGQRVLIIGATGGVGMFCVQLAKLWGLHVTAVCREANVAFARELGADDVIAYDVEDPLRLNASFDLIVDAAAKHTFSRCAHLLTARGTYVNTLPGPRMFFDAFRTSLFGRRRARFLIAQMTAPVIETLAQLAATRKIKVVVGHTFRLEEARAAFELSRSEHARGKIVVTIADENA